jgi:hypothetical protein
MCNVYQLRKHHNAGEDCKKEGRKEMVIDQPQNQGLQQNPSIKLPLRHFCNRKQSVPNPFDPPSFLFPKVSQKGKPPHKLKKVKNNQTLNLSCRIIVNATATLAMHL